MHVSGHINPFAHEAHGSKSVSGTRKKPPNREEVGAVKDHFSEDRQQERQRPPIKSPRVQAAAPGFEEASVLAQNADAVHAHAIHGDEGKSIALLLREAAPNADGSHEIAQPKQATVTETSLNDLLTLMRGNP